MSENLGTKLNQRSNVTEPFGEYDSLLYHRSAYLQRSNFSYFNGYSPFSLLATFESKKKIQHPLVSFQSKNISSFDSKSQNHCLFQALSFIYHKFPTTFLFFQCINLQGEYVNRCLKHGFFVLFFLNVSLGDIEYSYNQTNQLKIEAQLQLWLYMLDWYFKGIY